MIKIARAQNKKPLAGLVSSLPVAACNKVLKARYINRAGTPPFYQKLSSWSTRYSQTVLNTFHNFFKAFSRQFRGVIFSFTTTVSTVFYKFKPFKANCVNHITFYPNILNIKLYWKLWVKLNQSMVRLNWSWRCSTQGNDCTYVFTSRPRRNNDNWPLFNHLRWFQGHTRKVTYKSIARAGMKIQHLGGGCMSFFKLRQQQLSRGANYA